MSSTVEEIIASPVHGHEGQCLVCYSDLEYPTITPCGHNEVCGKCHLRLRFLHNDQKCPICKSNNPQVICDVVSSQKKQTFDDYPLWGNELGENYKYCGDQVGMFFPCTYYQEEIEPLFGYHCIDCDEFDGTTTKKKPPLTPIRALQDHLRNKHRLTLCQLCVKHKRDFISQLPRFTPSQLKIHEQKGDNDGSRGHPLCEFCRPRRFYDLAELHAHLARDHYKCHVCETQGFQNQYFRNYHSLEKHFELKHYLCQDAQCRAARFVVFENEIDLRGHEISIHGATSNGSTKIQLEFRYKRSNEIEQQQNVPSESDFQYGLNGQAFVPEDLEENVNTVGAPSEELSHPLHLQRTKELRAHAAQIRNLREMQQAPEAFPSLQGESVEASSSANASLRVGWTGATTVARRNSNNMSTENFPSLPSTTTTTTSGNKKRAALLGKSGVTSNRQFAAIQSAASSNCGWTGGTLPNVAAAPPSTRQSSSYPSLSMTATARSTPTSAVASLNRESNLTQDNFPSLGGTTITAPRFTAAENLARKKPPPSFSSVSDFPTPQPPPSTTKTASVRQQVLAAPLKKPPPPPAVDNVLDFPPPTFSNKEVTLDEIKTTLGTIKYKQLRKLTKEFAADALAPDAYVDHAASLFEGGYADRDFWSFLPTLLSSCPNTASANKAQQYMEQLRRRNQTSISTSTAAAAASSGGGWSNKPPKVTAAVVSRPTAAAAVSTTSSWTTPSTTSRNTRPAVATAASKSKSTSAWSAGATSTVARRASQKPGSVSAATVAAAQAPAPSTATKFMANEAKKAKKQETKKAKKKEKDELRALAFGGK